VPCAEKYYEVDGQAFCEADYAQEHGIVCGACSNAITEPVGAVALVQLLSGADCMRRTVAHDGCISKTSTISPVGMAPPIHCPGHSQCPPTLSPAWEQHCQAGACAYHLACASCIACNEGVVAGQSAFVLGSSNLIFHERCLRCSVCDSSIETLATCTVGTSDPKVSICTCSSWYRIRACVLRCAHMYDCCFAMCVPVRG